MRRLRGEEDENLKTKKGMRRKMRKKIGKMKKG